MLDLKPQRVCLFYAFLEQVKFLPSEAIEILSRAERNQYAQFFFDKDKERFLLARYLLRSQLTQYFSGIKPEDWKFKFNSYGKPFVSQEHSVGPIHFNLSHSDQMVVAAFAIGAELGVDVENTSRSVRTLSIAQKSFTHLEYQYLKSLGPGEAQGLEFFRLWTLKEAYTKAKGMGLQIPFNQFSFEAKEGDSFEIKFDSKTSYESADWKIKIFHPAPAYLAAVAVQSAAEIHFQEIFWKPE